MSLNSGEDSLSAAVLDAPAEDRPDLRLLVEHTPRRRTFLGDVGYVLRRKPPLPLGADASQFWTDVFVPSRISWTSFVESLVYHTLALTALLAWAHWMPHHITRQDPWKDTRLVMYPISDLAKAELPKNDLPKLDTGSAAPHRAQQGDPAYSRQPILSVPREPDNREQMLVTPPDIVLHRDVRLPNIVAWNALPSAPPPALTGLASERNLKAPDISVIAPPPQLDATHTNNLSLPQTATVAPPPELKDASQMRNQPTLASTVVPPPPQLESSARKFGAINIGHAEVVAPAPQLPMSEQRTLNEAANRQSAASQALSSAVVPPPPSVPGGGATASGQMIALSVHPAAPAVPVQPPAGNRRGEFSATPQGSALGSGRPTIPDSAKAAQHDSGTGGAPADSVLPAGIRVGEANTTASPAGGGSGTQSMASITIDRHPIAATPTIPTPRVDAAPRKPATLSEHAPTDVERKVFGARRFYQMTLNMPNLNSASGSWVLRFAELKAGPSKGELLSPLVTRKSDPAYPSELQRANVQGTVTLYAIIHSDGSVREIRVLDGVDDQLDQFASEALGRCHFEPALKDGAPVALEAVVMIPFRARRAF